MKPDDPNDRRSTTPLIPQRTSSYATHIPSRDLAVKQGAAAIARVQLDTIYDAPHTSSSQISSQPPLHQSGDESRNPYYRTHTDLSGVQAEQWKQYHSA